MRSQLLGRSQMNHLWVKSYQLSILGGKSFIIARGNQMWDKKSTWTQFLWSLCLSTFWIADTDVHSELILEPFFPRANGCVLFFSAIFPHRLLLVGGWPLDIRQPTTEEAERARKVAIQALNCTANILGISIVLQTFLELSVVQKNFLGSIVLKTFSRHSVVQQTFSGLFVANKIQLFSVFKTSQFKRCLLMPRTRPQGWHEGNPTMAHPEILQIRKTNPVNHRSN